MFEDGPPPLPPPLPPVDVIADGALADLNDDSRFTAVADDDVNVNDDIVSYSPPGIPNFDPEVFIGVAQPTVIFEPVRDTSSTVANGTYETSKAGSNTERGNSSTESPSRFSLNHSVAVHGELTEEVWSLERRRPSGNVEENETHFVSEKFVLSSGSDHPDGSTISTEQEHVDAELQPNGPDDRVSEIRSKSQADEPRHQESSIFDKKVGVLLKRNRSADEVEVVSGKLLEPSSASSSFLEGTGNASTALSGVFEEENAKSQLESDEDFGDFEEFVEFPSTHAKNDMVAKTNEEQDEFVGWAAFESASSGSHKSNDEGDNGWAADFANAPTLPAHVQQQTFTSILQQHADMQLCALHEIYDGDSLWTTDNVAWDDSESEPESSHDEMESVVGDLDGTDVAVDNLKPWQSLWLAISIVEEALALKMQWTHSAFYSDFLDSLNLDANLAMMRNSNLPAFAQQLDESAILQPMTSIDASNDKSGMTSHGSSQSFSLAQFNSSSGLPSNVSKASRRSSVQSAQRPKSVPVDSLAVPPAQFDWGNSGLTNPLTAGSISASSALLDLDFLTANESRIVTIAGRSSTTADISAALQKDLAALGLDASGMATQKETTLNNTTENKASLLEQLMRKGTQEHKYTPPSELSLDARALHDRLPDLDYMLANVLLFPMANR
uniref:Aftiphilin clathrin-binding box domain-containing protein n=1 Tax=Parascaris univalens TaxID=6257 RepID=A0A914ZLT0_PARUN